MGRVAGLQYNGAVFRHLGSGADRFEHASGVYAVMPAYMEELSSASRVKVGFAGTKYADSTSGSIAKRMSDYSTCFVEFYIPALIFYQGAARAGGDYKAEMSHNDANKAEREMKAWLKQNGHTPIVHVSGKRESEWYEITLEVLRQLFVYMTNMNEDGILGKKPEPSSAWWFGNDKIPVGADFNREIDKYNEFAPISVSRDDRDRRNLEKQLREAEAAQREGRTKPKDRFLVRDLRAKLSAMLNPGIVRIEDDVIPSEQGVLPGSIKDEPATATDSDLSSIAGSLLKTFGAMTASTVTDDDDGAFYMTDASKPQTARLRAPKKTKKTTARKFYNTRSSMRQLRSQVTRYSRF